MATRKLILKRKKVITGFAVKAFIYLADSIGDFMIKGIRCRELGFLKNGGSAEYDIPTTSTTIYVVSNRMSPDKHH
ncbi:MAG: hypothetical protein LBH69_04980, partial [Methanomassiliicoccaceae archaeon]|nr:hypothetical protein [Methanomassiliicoccaceae archaeon]